MSDSAIESLTTAFEESVLGPPEINPNKILFISLTLRNEQILDIIKIFKIDDFIINKKFHITILYTGGKPNENLETLKPFFNKTCEIEIHKIAISDKFITLGVSKITYDNSDIPYFGNEVKHITVGKKYSKLAPKDSPNAFLEGIVMHFEKPYKINGLIEPELKD